MRNVVFSAARARGGAGELVARAGSARKADVDRVRLRHLGNGGGLVLTPHGEQIARSVCDHAAREQHLSEAAE
jgi:hypothetical protein